MKTKNKIKTLIIMFIAGLTLGGFIDEAFAPYPTSAMRFPSSGSSSFPTPRYTPPPNVHPIIGPPKYYYRDVIKTLNKSGLETRESEPVPNAGIKTLPAKVMESARFLIPSSGGDLKGCVLCFNEKNAMRAVANHYQEMNKKGELYNWTFAKDNILLVLPGSLPEQEARRYEKALKEMK